MKKPSIDIISSALNEELCIVEFLDQVTRAMQSLPLYSYRILIVDNGSSDGTWDHIVQASRQNRSVVGIQMSRTFPLDAALTCGLDYAVADYVIFMTSDLQDPPSAIPSLLSEIERGFDQVVVVVASRRSVPISRRVLSRLFYRLANWITEGLIPENVSDFRIMNRKSYIALRGLRESHRFLRGLGAWVGFKTGMIAIERPPRFAGQSKWLGLSLGRVTMQAMQGILAHSTRPLQWLAATSFALGCAAILSIPALTLFWLEFGVPFQGFGWITTLIIVFFALMMMTLATVSMFIMLIYEEVKQRPLYIVKQTVGRMIRRPSIH
jgi:glycosyltransferase involved in cell wall biosynthesis